MTNMALPIYLDYASTTPVDALVAKKMNECLTREGHFGNPASRSHQYGWAAEDIVDEARANIANLVKAQPEDIVFTSGATESNNLALKGAAHSYSARGKHIVTSMTEHKSVLDTTRQLEREGFEVTYLKPDSNGLIQPSAMLAALREDTILASLMHVNNEIGVIQDIEQIGKICRQKRVLLHVDAAQSTGKVPIDLMSLHIDLMSFSAHKTYGPKGIGALYLRPKPKVQVEAQIHGGGHEFGVRSGTLATHQIAGMGEAFRLASLEMNTVNTRILTLRNRLWNGIKEAGVVYINGDMQQRVASNLNVSFADISGDKLMLALEDVAVSSGSACNSANPEPSYVLRALGVSQQLARNAVRFSLGRFTTEKEIDYVIDAINRIAPKQNSVEKGFISTQKTGHSVSV